MNTHNSLGLIPLCLGGMMLASLATGCGVEVRPGMPTLRARAVVAPTSFTTESQPATTYAAAPPQEQAATAPSGPQSMPDEVATVGQYQQSGGATRETAEMVAIGSTLIGRVLMDAPRYYAIDLAAGDVVQFKAYTRLLKGGSCNFSVKIIEPDDVVLEHLLGSTMSSLDWSRQQDRTAAKQDGRHLIRFSATRGIEFKLLISGATAAK